jgi:Rad3-related DNA helicase
MNSAKWASEVAMGRLPEAPLTVVDEADEWLDSLALKLSLTRKRIDDLKRRLDRAESRQNLEEEWRGALGGEVDPLDLAYELALMLEELDETSMDLFWKLRSVLEHRRHVEVEIREQSILYLVPDPKPVLHRVLNRVGGKWLLMSATTQEAQVLHEVFGIDPVFVEGETRYPGKIIQRRLGVEIPVVHRSWSGSGFKEEYQHTLSEILARAKRPCFLPVHAFKYLPPTLAEELRSSGRDFLEQSGLLITTKMDRGADLKGMGSIVLTKFPFPEREDPLLRGMERRLGREAFRRYYQDIAERCFIQQIGRVLRSDEDEVEFWSPDLICHRMLRKLWKGRVEVAPCFR